MSSLSTLFLTADDSHLISERIFGLDAQFLADACILALAVFVLFVILSYLVFNPARDLLRRRQEKIQGNLDSAEKDKKDAESLKRAYDEKLHKVAEEADELLSVSRKKALKKETEILEEARAEAARIIKRAEKEAALEKSKMKDDVKKEMISVAAAMAGTMVSVSMSEAEQDKLLADTLNAMGTDTWDLSRSADGSHRSSISEG